MGNIRCFVAAETGLTVRYLRRYAIDRSGDHKECPLHGYHNQKNFIGKGFRDVDHPHDHLEFYPRDDARWPRHCDCGYEFKETDDWQVFTQTEYCRADDPAIIYACREDLPPGALYRAGWMEDLPSYRGPDGQSWVVMTPLGPWNIDSIAGNCTRPGEKHKCWCRHGEPPNFTIDKNCDTCNAGAGSVRISHTDGKMYHAMLQEGELRPCGDSNC